MLFHVYANLIIAQMQYTTVKPFSSKDTETLCKKEKIEPFIVCKFCLWIMGIMTKVFCSFLRAHAGENYGFSLGQV